MSADLRTSPARPLLGERIRPLRRKIETGAGVVAFPHFWQVPASTEKAAGEAMMGAGAAGFDYVAFPWATLIDAMRNGAPSAWDLLRALSEIAREHPSAGARRATVVQHIHADRFLEFYRAVGITDLFWSHATLDRPVLGGMRVHPFPLFPAQTADLPPRSDLHAPRRYLANFIGAYNPHIYLSDVRARIFADAGSRDDLLIVKREVWHFDRAVYDEQIRGLRPDEARLRLEAEHKREYLDAIRDSAFTLCPTGSGPNSIRIGEALALGSIPIILTRLLALPGDRALWERACLIEEDTQRGYRAALDRARAMPAAELRARQAATQALYAEVGPAAFDRIVQARMTGV